MLTTLMIIGVIATVTIPAFNNNVSNDVLEKQHKVFNGKLEEALHVMQMKGDLAKSYDTTEDFVNAMKKYIRIESVCDSDNLTNCFTDKIRSSMKDVKYNVADIHNSGDIEASFSTASNLAGIIFSDGTRAIIAHDPNCIVTDTFSTSADVKACFSMIYDVNGKDGPDIIGQDIETINTSGMYGVPFIPQPITQAQCTEAYLKGAPLPINNPCPFDNDYYGGAIVECFNQGKHIATKADLDKLITKLYSSGRGNPVQNKELWVKTFQNTNQKLFIYYDTPNAGTNAEVYGFFTNGLGTNVNDRNSLKRADVTVYAMCVSN